MKKILITIGILSSCLLEVASAQDVKVSGVVKDVNGNSLPLALVQDKSDNVATRADSAGKFTLSAKPNSKLLITSAGYKSKVVDVKDKTDIQVILTAETGTDTQQAASTTTDERVDLQNEHGAGSGMLYVTGVASTVTSFKYVEATKGNRYLFPDWVTGYVVSPQDSVYKNPSYGFNYDKINGILLLSTDKKTSVAIDQDKIKTFTLYDKNTIPSVYEYVPEIDKIHFTKLIEGGSKYKIYKLTTTKFTKNDYHTDGMISSGNNYDEYVDEDTYYVMNVKTKQVQPFKLKKKSIKTAFAADADKVNSYFESNSDDINDSYLVKLGTFINN